VVFEWFLVVFKWFLVVFGGVLMVLVDFNHLNGDPMVFMVFGGFWQVLNGFCMFLRLVLSGLYMGLVVFFTGF